MSVDIIRIAAVCILATILCKLFGASDKEYAVYIKLVAAIGVLGAIIIYVSPIVETVNEIFIKAQVEETYLDILFKALGICYITQFAYDICKDSGENALATQVETAGKVSLLLIALPLFRQLAELVTEFAGY